MIPVQSRLNEIVTQKPGPAGDEQALAGDSAELFPQTVTDVVQILPYDVCRATHNDSEPAFTGALPSLASWNFMA